MNDLTVLQMRMGDNITKPHYVLELTPDSHLYYVRSYLYWSLQEYYKASL
jgi:hypothetical protein